MKTRKPSWHLQRNTRRLRFTVEHLCLCTDSLVLGRREPCSALLPWGQSFLNPSTNVWQYMRPVQSKWTMCSVGEYNSLFLSCCLTASTVNNQEKRKHFQQSGSLREREREGLSRWPNSREKTKRARGRAKMHTKAIRMRVCGQELDFAKQERIQPNWVKLKWREKLRGGPSLMLPKRF